MFLLDQTDRKWIIGGAGTPPTGPVLLRGWRGAWVRDRSPGSQNWLSWPSTAGTQQETETGQEQPVSTRVPVPRPPPPPGTTYLLLGPLGLQQGVPVSDGLAWVGQHLVPVVPAQSLGAAAHPHHPDDLVVADPVAAHVKTGEPAPGGWVT